MNTIGRTRKSALLGGSALMLVLCGSSAVQAQCVGTGAFGALAAAFTPFASGASVNSLVSVLNTVNTAFLTQSTAFIGSPPDPQPNQTGGGVWARAIGGRVDTNSTGVTTGSFAAGNIPIPGNITCNTSARQNFGGVQVGTDVARFNVDGWNLHVGTTAGYMEAKANDTTPGGVGTGNLQVPFVGIYAAATKGGLFIDGQVRQDFFQMNVSDATNGVFGQNFDARGTAVSGNIGYNHALENGWFVEPSAGFIWSRVKVDPLNVSGTFILANNPGIAPPGTVAIGDIQSELGRASVRVGTNFVSGNVAYQPFATASVFHEFAGNVTTRFSSNFAAIGLGGILPDVNASLSTSRVGTYGQFAVGIAGQIVNTGWLGYARVDYRKGENIEGASVNAGIRYQFTPDPAPARGAIVAKAPILKAPPAMAVPVTWGGFYIGGYVGATHGWTDWRYVANGARTDPKFAGILAGGQVGFNYQTGSWVLGVEAEEGGTNAKGAKSCPNAFFFTCENHMDRLGSLTGRLGYASERTLFYAKAGAAFAHVREQTSCNPDSQPLILIGPCPVPPVNGTTKTVTGGTIGAGAEYALTQNWSAKAESMYYSFGRNRFTVDNALAVNVNSSGVLTRVGVNYRFSAP